MLFTKLIAVYSENYKKHKYTVGAKRRDFYDVKADVTYSHHCAFTLQLSAWISALLSRHSRLSEPLSFHP
jgi:hypothetical protein